MGHHIRCSFHKRSNSEGSTMIKFEDILSEYKTHHREGGISHFPKEYVTGYPKQSNFSYNYIAPKFDVVRREPFMEVELDRSCLAVYEGGMVRLHFGYDLPYKKGQDDIKTLNDFGLNIHSTRYIDASDFSLPDPLVQQGEIFKGTKPVFRKAHICNGDIFVINKGKAYLRNNNYRNEAIQWENGEVGGVGEWTVTPPDKAKRKIARRVLKKLSDDMASVFGFVYDERRKYLKDTNSDVAYHHIFTQWQGYGCKREVAELLASNPDPKHMFERALFILSADKKTINESYEFDRLAFTTLQVLYLQERNLVPSDIMRHFTHVNEINTHPYLIVNKEEKK